ncbi:hypothetical protein TVAG_083060 [Trichomonas vaginalis G3]|uniref:Right handed beta helix domain-containing protein n=1 Tax=Trichomonas vaginalis (strain ATCC PRA-98 / G3) TaxID=412133 RepID=A2DM35_TRIV3|nr:pectin lyase-like family [Trichomonas vaginalis G3]EAY18455.1 hypothetical protein TVAG_083060 [Trichomonas vaginalis G3]KAI5489556.1 pectin lyase-like family [Trichomonas vaginalis G3]|eukprot:XP_001579441.1 hypothetical protein [Trichomonas vaginalis G3]
MSEKNYYLLFIEVQDLKTNAIFIQNKNNINALIESCKFTNVITNIPTQKNGAYNDTRAGTIFFEIGDSNCIINRCMAFKCYNKIVPSEYYYDGGQFATIRFARNQILVTSIVSSSDQSYGVSPFRSRDTSGNYTCLNISNCKSYDSALFTVFPGESDYIKYSLFDGNSATKSDSKGISVLYNGKFTIRQCIFTQNSLKIFIYARLATNVVIEECNFAENRNENYLAYAVRGRDGRLYGYSKIIVSNCYFKDSNTRNYADYGATVSFDNKNNASIKDRVLAIMCNALHPHIISGIIKYQKVNAKLGKKVNVALRKGVLPNLNLIKFAYIRNIK